MTTSFNDDGTFYSTFQANLTNVGTYTISATGYSDKFTNTTITEGTLTVSKLNANLQVSVGNTIYPNSITIKVTSDADGNYTYTVGSLSGIITVSNGTGSVILSKLAIGSYSANVTYSDIENYTQTSVVKSFKIIKAIQANSNVKMYYLDGTSTYTVRIYDSNGNIAGAGVKVTFKINGKTYTRTTNSNGYAILKLSIKTLVPGSYKITATYNGYTVSNTVKVKNVIKAKKTTKVKKSAKKLKIKIKLKGKTVYKKKTIKVKFKGKTYKVKTNKKGIAYFKLTKKVIKKLKAGKKFKYKITYGKSTLKRYIKVKK